MKRIAVTEMWSIDLEKAGVELGDEGVRSAILTRSVSVRPRFVLATTEKLVIVAVKDGKVEFQEDLDAGLDKSSSIKLFTVH